MSNYSLGGSTNNELVIGNVGIMEFIIGAAAQ